MKKTLHQIEVGDRFETRDTRDQGKVVEVVEALGLDENGRDSIAKMQGRPGKLTAWGSSKEDYIEYTRQRHTHYRIRTEVHPNNPGAVGRTVKAQENTLREKYRRVSR